VFFSNRGKARALIVMIPVTPLECTLGKLGDEYTHQTYVKLRLVLVLDNRLFGDLTLDDDQ
jgi:hypothetical protein